MALKDKYFTISEAAKQLGVTRQTISRWVAKGYVPAEKVGRTTLINKKNLDKYRWWQLSEEAAEHIVAMYENYVEEYLRQKGKLGKNQRIGIGGNPEDKNWMQLTDEEKTEVGELLRPYLVDFLEGFAARLKTLGVDKPKE